MDTLFIFGAHYLYLFALASALYFFWTLPAQDKISIIVFSVTSLIATYIMVIIVGHLYYDPRPFTQTHIAPLIPHDPDNGFPSDHTVLLSAIACTFYPFSKKTAYILFIFAAVVGLSRVYVGIHHPIDVLGSMGIAIITSVIIYKLYQVQKQHAGQKHT